MNESRRFDVEGYKKLMADMDGSNLGDFYDQNAVVTVVDQDRSPKDNVHVRGLRDLEDLFHDIGDRQMTHEIRDCFLNEEGTRMAFIDDCTYGPGPYEGVLVVVASVATLLDGKIVKQVQVQAWDH